MQPTDLKKNIHPSIPFSILLVVLYLALWAINTWLYPVNESFDAVAIRLSGGNAIINMSVILLFTIFNLLLIDRFNYHFSLIRTKTFLPIFIFALLILTWKESHLQIYTHFALTLWMGSMMLFFNMYRNKKASQQSFLGSLLLSVSSILNPVYLVLFPLVWIGFVILNCLSIRTFLASLIGIIVPWIFYYSFQVYLNAPIEFFPHFETDFQPDILFLQRSLIQQIYIIASIVMLLIALFSMYRNHFNDSVQTRKYLNVMVLFLLFFILTVIVFSNNILAFMPMIAFCYAILVSHPFSLVKSKFNTILFLLFVLNNIVYLFYHFLTFK